jgi:muramidase (phage lysozyme)
MEDPIVKKLMVVNEMQEGLSQFLSDINNLDKSVHEYFRTWANLYCFEAELDEKSCKEAKNETYENYISSLVS